MPTSSFIVWALSVATIFVYASGLSSQIFLTNYDQLRALQLLWLVGMLAAIAVMPGARLGAVAPPIVWLCATLLLVAGWAAISAPSYGVYAITEAALFAGLLLVGSLLREPAVSAEALRRWIILALALASVVLTVRFSTEIVAMWITGQVMTPRQHTLPFINPRYFAKVATWTIPALLGVCLVFRGRSWLRTVGFSVLGGLACLQLIHSGGRGAVIGLGVSALLCLLVPMKRYRIYGAWLIAWMLVGAVGAELLALLRGDESVHLYRDGVSGREALYESGLAYLRAHPLLGAGPTAFAWLSHDNTSAGPHGWPLQFLSEWGLPAGLAMCVFLMGLTLRVAKAEVAAGNNPPLDDGVYRAALFVALIASGIHGLVSNVINDPFSQMLLVMGFAVMLPTAREKPQFVLWPLRLLCLTLVLILILSLFHGARCFVASSDSHLVPTRADVISPRFWSQGLVPYEQTCLKTDD